MGHAVIQTKSVGVKREGPRDAFIHNGSRLEVGLGGTHIIKSHQRTDEGHDHLIFDLDDIFR
jgi:hypothetical protein